jgi:hypothetical protein
MQLALELVEPADVVGALGAEHRRLQLVDVLLDRAGDVDEGVDDVVGDGVEDRGGPRHSRSRCSSSRCRSSVSPLCSPCRTVIT